MRGLAGKYAPILGAAAAGLAGAGGSIIGNLTDAEQGEGPARIATEALMAGVNILPTGYALGHIPGMRRDFQKQVVKGIPRSTPNAKGLRQEAMAGVNKGLNLGTGINLAMIPAGAGIGGLLGGGVSNVANMIGVPGYQPGVVVNPESYGSSNVNYNPQAIAG